MATHSDAAAQAVPPPPPPAQPIAQGHLVEYEQFIDDQLRRTRSHVRSVDLTGSVMLLVAGSVTYFFLIALIDHWVIPGGLGFIGRLLALTGFVLAAIYFLATDVLPLLLRRINPVYAAYTIERSRPGMKNGLVNFLLFRAQPGTVSPVVYQAIEEQAATNLAKGRAETAVDRSKLIHIGYALVSIVFVCAVYALFSPKDLFQTVERVVLPWAEISAPTRTSIVEIEPGDARVFRGQQLPVAARVSGLSGEGKVVLYYSTDDGQLVDRAVEMNLPPDGYKYSCLLPAGDSSLQQSLTYRIAAGDATTRTYHVEVVAAPTIVVERVNYQYPPYTGLLAQRVEHQGDIKAIERTEITIEALANQDMQSAGIDFDCDGKVDVRMKVEQQVARGTFKLELKEDRQSPRHTSYQLLFKNEQGQQNPQPVRHQIEITRDLSPEIQFVGPKSDELDLPLNGVVDLELVAHDPDFALRTIKLVATLAGRNILDKALLDEVWRGQCDRKFRFEPRRLGLKAGDVVEYLAWAEDNKDPLPNRVTTPPRRIRIASAVKPENQSDRVAEKGEPGIAKPDPAAPRGDRQDGPADQHDPAAEEKSDTTAAAPPTRPEDRKPAEGESGTKPDAVANNAEQPPGDQQAGKSEDSGSPAAGSSGDKKDKPSAASEPAENVANDGSDDGTAIEKILERQQEQSQEKSGQNQGGEKQTGSQQKPGDQPQSGDKQQPGDKQQSGDKSQAGKGEKQQSGDKQKPGDKQQSDGKSQSGKGDQPQSGDKQESKQGQGDQPASEAAKSDGRERSGEQPGQEPQGKEDKPAKRPPNKKNDPSDRSQGKSDQKGAGAGDNGQGNDQGGGQDGEKGQPGQQGKSGQSSSQGAGSGENPGEAGENQAGQKSQGGKKGAGDKSRSGGASSAEKGDQGESGDRSKSDSAGGDDSAKPDQGSESGQGSKPGKQSPGKKSDGEQGKPGDDGQAPGKPDKSAEGGDKSSGKSDSGDGAGEKPSDGSGQPPADAGKPSEKNSGKGRKQPADRDGQGRKSPGDEASDGAEKQTEGQAGQGDKAKGDAQNSPEKQPHDQQGAEAKGGDQEKEKGSAGAGQKGGNPKGSPSPAKQNQGREKSQSSSPDDKNEKPGDDAQSPSNSDKESDSQGQNAGDESGGGKQGGGQKANKPGTGGPGENTPSDEGAGQADESGPGETSDRPGRDQQAKGKTGSSGSKPGEGSKSDSSSGDQRGAGKPQPKGGAGSQSSNNSSDQPAESTGTQSSGAPGAGKPPQSTRPNKPSDTRGDEQADAANLEYARKATDLAVNHLKDELRKDRPDPELLNRLGWTKKDLEHFVERWEQMRKQSQSPGAEGTAARRELDESLRSLGLRPRGTSMRSKATRDDQMQGVKESRHTTPPLEYLDQSKAYSQGTARGDK